MMHHAGSLSASEASQFGWVARAVFENAVRSINYFIVLMKESAAHERDRRQLSKLDTRMLQDIGLEPFDVYYGWRGSGACSRGFFRTRIF